MNWKAFLVTTTIASIIIYFQWPNMKELSKKDKFVMIGILAISLLLSMFHLEQMKAPVTFRKGLLKPFEEYMKNKQF